MKLLTKALKVKIPPLYANEKKSLEETMAVVKLFTPDGNWTWYITEFDGVDRFFGLVDGFEKELGYFSLSELLKLRGPMGLPVERDMYWTPKSLKELMG
jgi:hypothetical protein